jgi:outer membrane protein TolC
MYPISILRSFDTTARAGVVASSLALLGLSGCQTFQSSPLDPSAHAEQWRSRIPGSDEVKAFARRLEAAGSPTVFFNPANGLTIPEGELVALVYNPDLRAARLKAGVAKATAEHAGRWDDPELSLDVLKITEAVPDPWIVGSALSFTLPVSGRLQVEKARAEAALHSELARVAEEEWKTMRDLRTAWLSWSADRLRLEETERIESSLDAVIETTAKLAESGELLRTEAALFKIEREARDVDVKRLRGKVEEGEQELRSILGLSPSAPARLLPAIATGETAQAKGALVEVNPTLTRLRSAYAVAELTLLREIQKQYPDVVLGPQFEDDEGQSRIGIVGAIPIPILNSNKGGIATARAEREVARAAFETEVERIEGRLATLRSRLSGIRARRKSLESSLVPLVDRQVADARRLVELGEGGSLVLLESLTRAHEAKLDLIEVRLEESETLTQIRHLLGPDKLRATTE